MAIDNTIAALQAQLAEERRNKHEALQALNLWKAAELYGAQYAHLPDAQEQIASAWEQAAHAREAVLTTSAQHEHGEQAEGETPIGFAYSTNQENYFGAFDTPEAAAAEAFANDPELNRVWIGEYQQKTAHAFVCPRDIIEAAQAQAYDEAGEFCGDWLAALERNKEDMAKLKQLVGDFLEGKEPVRFFTVENVREVTREEIEAFSTSKAAG